ncbi:MAG: thioesterase family protein [Pseudomonadota bacterium]
MTVAFDFQVTWSDLDANNHLRNTGYLDYAAQSRFLYFDSRGFGPADFRKLGIGPAVLSETIQYRRELRLLDHFQIQLSNGGENRAQSRFIFVNTIFNADGKLCADVRSTFVWFSQTARKIVPAPPPLLEAMHALPRNATFEEL